MLNISTISKEFGDKFSTALLGLHAFTGCDTTSAFKGIGKLKPIKILQKSPEFESSLSELGESWEVSDRVVKDLEIFTCRLYGSKTTSDIDLLRLNLLKSKCDYSEKLDSKKCVDFAMFPPCQDSLLQHIKRCNYQTAIWKCGGENFPEIPEALHHGWVLSGDLLEPMWCREEVLPGDLSELLDENDDSSSDESISELQDSSDDSYSD